MPIWPKLAAVIMSRPYQIQCLHMSFNFCELLNMRGNTPIPSASSLQDNEIILYQPYSTVKLGVRLENETVWLTQQQIADLFGTKRPAITKHLANIYKSGELQENSTCSILEHMGNDGTQRYTTKYYNLDTLFIIAPYIRL